MLRHAFSFSRREVSEFCIVDVPHEEQRAQGMPDAHRTHGPPATKKAGGSHHRYAETIRHSLRDGLRLMARSPRGAGLDSPRHFRETSSQSLTSASGGQDHALLLVRLGSPSSCASPKHPPQPAARFVTIGRNVPLNEAGWQMKITFSDFQQSNYFSSKP